MGGRVENFFARKWSYPLIFIILILLNFIIYPFASNGYALQNTGSVISSVLSVSILPYEFLAPVFHVAIVVLIVVIGGFGARASRIFAVYVGVNYVFIAFDQMIGATLEYGLVILTGGLVSYVLIGIFWFWDASNSKTETVFSRLPLWRYWSIPLAVLAFWCPINVASSLMSPLVYSSEFIQVLTYPPISWMILLQSPSLYIQIQFISSLFTSILMSPNFNPLFLLTSAGYGLTFCMTTPVFLCLLTLFYPRVNKPAYTITALVGLIYGAMNVMLYLFIPSSWWMGVLHFPLLFISIYALILPRIVKEKPLLEATKSKKLKH